MRPIELTMSAFGPYAKEQVINFDALGKSGLYLITGDTGAGKTTIFDAISFALFGDASGEGREAKMLRSKYATIDTPTFVELRFEYNGKEYTVRRNPEYERQSKRGDKMTKELADASLILPDGRAPISKVNEVTEFIEELLGINRDQFAQIAMIAQGEFKKLLNAETKDRKEIFRKLFKTEKYDALQNYLKQKASELERECAAKNNSISQYVNGIMCDETSVLSLKVEDLKAGKMPVVEAKTVLDEIIEEDSELLEKNGDLLKETEDKLTEIEGIFKKVEDEKKAREDLKERKAELAEREEKHDRLETELAAAEGKKDEIEDLRDAASKLEGELPLYEEREAKRKEYLNKKAEYDQSVLARDGKSAELGKCGEQIDNLKKEQEGYKGLGGLQGELKMKLVGLDLKDKAFYAIDEGKKGLDGSRADYAEETEKFEKARDERQFANREYMSLSEKFLGAQAGILAEKLNADEACPVCGSHEHPKLAKVPAEAPTEQQLKEAERAFREADERLNKVTARMGRLDGAIKTAEENLKKDILKVLDAEESGDLTQESALSVMLERAEVKRGEVTKQMTGVKARLDDVNRKMKRNEEIDEDLKELEKSRESLNREVGELKEKVGVLDAEMKGLEKQGKELEKKLVYKSEDEAKAEIDAKKKRAKEFEDAIEGARGRRDENKNKIAEVKGRIRSLEEQLKKTVEVDTEKLAAEKEELTGLKDEYTKEDRKINARMISNTKTQENLVKGNDALKKLVAEFEMVRNLSDTANGMLKGKDRIMLEIYVQTTFFDRIIQKSNTRFFIMTGEHYELKRAGNVANRVNQSGLDLNVVDHYNGTERSVKSLSGGESFMASLSLALGLSDEIQMSVGGIKLATMFIDEGFGSLDMETLKLAMDALSELANPEGGKLVGIISHVEELKNRVEKQIVVTKDVTGASEAKVVV